MKRFISCLTVLGLVLGISGTAPAATEAQKLAAIDAGLSYLYGTQQANGSWDYGSYDPAATGAVVLAFVSQQANWGANAVAYQAAVDKAVDYLLSVATLTSASTRNDGVNICPGGIGSCPAVYWDAANNEDSYTTGLIIPALATYAAGKAGDVATLAGPLAGLTWGQIAQANNNLWAASQSTANQGVKKGGWRYILGTGGYDSDMSTTQWGIISLIYNETLGATAPPILKTDLAAWLASIQAANGSGCYVAGTYCDHSDTGGLLLGLKYLGKPIGDAAVQSALGFLDTNWPQTANSTWYGNFNHPYAMWSVYKGLEVNIGLQDTTTITNFLTTCGYPSDPPGIPPGSLPCNWWQDYNEWLVTNQNGDGSWTGYSNWYGPLATAFYVNILGGTPIPTTPECAILGQDVVKIGAGSSVTADPSNVCSNDTLRTDADVSVDTSLLALGDMNLGAGTEVDRDAFTNGSLRTGAEVSIGFADGPLDLDVDAGINLWLGTGTEVEGGCQYADTGNLHAGTAAGCGAPPIQVPRPPYPIQNAFVLPECLVTPPAAGAPDIHTPAMSDAYYGNPLTPGDYGTVSFGSNNRVAIEGGEYHFLSLKFGPKTKVEIRGPITVHVVDKLRFADGVQEILAGQVAAKDILYLVDGAADADPEHRGGANTVLLGTFCGPDSTISFGNGTELTGAIIGKEVRLGASVDFTAEPAQVQ